MGPEDIASLFFGDEASGPQKAMQLAQALRGQQQLGTLGMLTGDKVLGNVGQHMLQGVGDREALIAKAGTQQNAQRLQLAMAKQEQDAALAREKFSQREQDARQRTALDAGKFVAGGGVVLDQHTGQYEMLPQRPGGMKEKDVDKGFVDFSNAINPDRTKAGLLGQYQTRIGSAKQLEALLKTPEGEIINATPQQVREAGTALAKLISSGSMSEHQISELTPTSMAGDWANLKQKIFNEPEGADSQKFLQQMLETAARETNVARQQLLEGQHRSIPAYSHLRGLNKTKFDSILKNNGIDPASIDDNGSPIAPKSGGAAPREGMVRIRDPKSGRTGWAPKDKLPAGVEVVPG